MPLINHLTAQKAVVAENIGQVIINLTRGLEALSTRYDGRVQNFLEYYLGTQAQPAPFGGRARDLAGLDAWLHDPAAPPYAALIAPAGRGKSALLAHWITRLESRPAKGEAAVHVVYFPISIRFNTNLETVVFASLAARLAHVFGEPVTSTPDPDQYRGVFGDYLRRKPPAGGRVLVVLDGLDEAAGWEAGADLFPTVPPSHLRVLVAARLLAMDRDETAWLHRLGWQAPNAARCLPLAGLDREEVRDVLRQMGDPLHLLATKIDLISRLHELSAGDPLLVRLYVEALLPQGAQAATLKPEDLTTLQPGLEAYFNRWFDEQQKLWDDNQPLRDKTVRGLLNLCATALGPLKKEDVLALAPDIFEDSLLLEQAAAAVNRFIIGDGLASGYVFSHPRLAEYFWGKLTAAEQQKWQERFLQYGRTTLTTLENKTLLPKNAPAYVAQYYSAHLAQARAPAADFYALVCESWLRAWEWLTGTPADFLNDVDRAWQQAEAEGPAALGQQIRAALCFASVVSLSANIPKDLLVACVKAKVISPALGLVIARQKPDPQERAACLAALAEFQPAEFDSIMAEALSLAREIANEHYRARALADLAPRLTENLLAEALSLARAIDDEEERARALAALAPRLPESLLAEAFSLARAIAKEYDRDRARALAALAPRLPEPEQAKVLAEALSLAREIANEHYRAQALTDLAPHLPENLLAEALSLARAIADDWSRAWALAALAPRLPEPEQKKVLAEALSLARAIEYEESRAEALAALAPRLPENLLAEALSLARAIADVRDRARALAALAPRLPEPEQVKVLAEALSLARAIADDWSRAEALAALAPHLPENLLAEALSLAREIKYDRTRARALAALAPRLPEPEQAKVLAEALSLARAIDDEDDRARALAALAPHLPESLLAEALSLAREIASEHYRARALAALAPHLPENLLAEALSLAREIADEHYRAWALADLAPRLPENLLAEALSLARAIAKGWFRASALAALAPRLPEPEQVKVLAEALSLARAIDDEDDRARALADLAPRLPENLLAEALSLARAIAKGWPRAKALADLAPRLPEAEQVKVLAEALSLARAIAKGWLRAEALAALAPRLPEPEQKKVLAEALSLARTIDDEDDRARALAALAPHLPESLLAEALSLARTIEKDWSRARALADLAPRLPENLLAEALSLARTIEKDWSRAWALAALAPRLPEPEQAKVLAEALSLARAIAYEYDRASALAALAPRLPEPEQVKVLAEALSLARAIAKGWFRASALAALAPRLPENLLAEALSLARAIEDERARASALTALAPRLPENLLGEMLQTVIKFRHDHKITDVLSDLAQRWSAVCRSPRGITSVEDTHLEGGRYPTGSTPRPELEGLSITLRAFARTQRRQLLHAIKALLPVIVELGGAPALRAIARAIVDTAKWWP